MPGFEHLPRILNYEAGPPPILNYEAGPPRIQNYKAGPPPNPGFEHWNPRSTQGSKVRTPPPSTKLQSRTSTPNTTKLRSRASREFVILTLNYEAGPFQSTNGPPKTKLRNRPLEIQITHRCDRTIRWHYCFEDTETSLTAFSAFEADGGECDYVSGQL